LALDADVIECGLLALEFDEGEQLAADVRF
jgi:hypothetical protein